MELFVVLPAPAAGGSPRTVALALAQRPEAMTVAELKEAISRRSARAYAEEKQREQEEKGCSSSSSCGHGEEEWEDDGMGGIPAALQRLTLGGRHLADECTLAECAVTEWSTLHVLFPLRGGIDFQNRDGSKFGGGGVMSESQANQDRRERLRKLALETIDLNKDPYFMRNHLGSYECKLCLTLHNNEGNYLAHTQGKRHQQNLARRAAKEARDAAQYRPQKPTVVTRRTIKIGRPGYKVTKARDLTTRQRSLIFEVDYPEAEEGVQPRHRFMSAFEQRVEPANKQWQYLLFACEPYETVGFKIPNAEIDKADGRFLTSWDAKAKKFVLQLFFREREAGKGDGNSGSRPSTPAFQQQQQQQHHQQQQRTPPQGGGGMGMGMGMGMPPPPPPPPRPGGFGGPPPPGPPPGPPPPMYQQQPQGGYGGPPPPPPPPGQYY